jgi:hypothetical protein
VKKEQPPKPKNFVLHIDKKDLQKFWDREAKFGGARYFKAFKPCDDGSLIYFKAGWSKTPIAMATIQIAAPFLDDGRPVRYTECYKLSWTPENFKDLRNEKLPFQLRLQSASPADRVTLQRGYDACLAGFRPHENPFAQWEGSHRFTLWEEGYAAGRIARGLGVPKQETVTA